MPEWARSPAWWYAAGETAPARLLRPLAAIWGTLAARRLERSGEPYRSNLPVVCVGNFTAGGAGKTPIALHIGAVLERIGVPFAYLTRGYGGRVRGPRWVDGDRDTADLVGDEPLLLARVAPTMVARRRPDGARAIAAGPGRAALIVMDDGLQNPSLARNLSLAVVDARRGLGNGLVIPAGPLRAPLPLQLALADAIIILGSDACPPYESEVAARLRRIFAGPVLAARTVPAGDTSWLRDRPVVAFAGIADPAKLFATLEGLGTELVSAIGFPDHHRFREADARRLLDAAAARGAALVTTEKDWVRLRAMPGAAGELAARSRPLAIRVAMEPGDDARLMSLLAGVVAVAQNIAAP